MKFPLDRKHLTWMIPVGVILSPVLVVVLIFSRIAVAFGAGVKDLLEEMGVVKTKETP